MAMSTSKGVGRLAPKKPVSGDNGGNVGNANGEKIALARFSELKIADKCYFLQPTKEGVTVLCPLDQYDILHPVVWVQLLTDNQGNYNMVKVEGYELAKEKVSKNQYNMTWAATNDMKVSEFIFKDEAATVPYV